MASKRGPVSVEVRGAEALGAVAKQLRGEARRLKVDVTKGIERAGLPLAKDARSALSGSAPAAGGLARVIANEPVRVSTTMGGKNPAVTLKMGRKGRAAQSLDKRGVVRRPVWGNRDRWVTQKVPDAKGDWTRTIERGRGKVEHEIAGVLKDVERRFRKWR